MVGQTVWWLSDSIVIQWEPKYFNEIINRTLKSIDSNKLQDAKGIFYLMLFLKRIKIKEKMKIVRNIALLEKLQKTLTTLLDAVKDLNMEIDATDNIQ